MNMENLYNGNGADHDLLGSTSDGSQIDSQMYQQLRKLINLVDELRDCGVHQYIQLPRICVLGTQSAGKSSVLEAIVGVDFLPRGDGVVTRRPLELRLVHLTDSDEDSSKAYAIFECDKNKKYYNFQQVREEIERLTDEAAGKNKGIIDSPIVLTVYAQNCPDLTLIDLPGITRVPLKGSDQNDDIETLTRQMALRYAQDPRTIILAVLAANADMSTSDALQLARRVDPRGVRTIGVITKIDLMDRGTDASKMLNGDDVPLRLGYTGVRNRSQADIKSGKAISECLEEEKHYFSTHPVYKSLPPHFLGVTSLIEKLTKVLFTHIKFCLPEIKKDIYHRIKIVEERISELGQGVPMESNERAQVLWCAITDFVEVFKNTIRGKYDKRLQLYFEQDQCLTIGSGIRQEYTSLLEEYTERKISEDMTDKQVETAILLHEGDALPGFPSPDTFQYLILPYLKRISPPVMDCLERVSQTLETLAQKIAHRVFGRFPLLAERVLEISQDLLTREKDATRDILQNFVDAETGYLFTNDSKYLHEHGSMIAQQKDPQEIQNMQNHPYSADGHIAYGPDGRPIPQSNTERAQLMVSQVQNSVTNLFNSKEKRKSVYSDQFIREIRKRLDAYFSIVLRNTRDTVPKVIGFFLVRQLQERLQFELYNKLNDETQFSQLLGEPAHIIEERRTLSAQLQTLKKAAGVLQRDPQITALNLDHVDEAFDADIRDLHRNPMPFEKSLGTCFAPSMTSNNNNNNYANNNNYTNNNNLSQHPTTPSNTVNSRMNTTYQNPSNNSSVRQNGNIPQPSSMNGVPTLASAGSQSAENSSLASAASFANAISEKGKSLTATIFGDSKASAPKSMFDRPKFQAATNPLFSD